MNASSREMRAHVFVPSACSLARPPARSPRSPSAQTVATRARARARVCHAFRSPATPTAAASGRAAKFTRSVAHARACVHTRARAPAHWRRPDGDDQRRRIVCFGMLPSPTPPVWRSLFVAFAASAVNRSVRNFCGFFFLLSSARFVYLR